MVDHYQNHGEARPDAATLLDEAKRFAAEGADKPFLDVWFDDENVGYVVGVFNLVFRTDDGGKHWVPWFDRTDNPKRYHLYAVRRVGDDLYAAGEQGIVLKLDAEGAALPRRADPLRRDLLRHHRQTGQPCSCSGCGAMRTARRTAVRPGRRSIREFRWA